MGAVSFNLETPSASLLAGNVGFLTGFEHIETVTVGSGGASSVSLSNIPQYYRHLQIRATTLKSSADILRMAINSDTTTTNYRWHRVDGDGTFVSSVTGQHYYAGYVGTTSAPGGNVIDVLDYSSTVKNKTVRSLWGNDRNGSGVVSLQSLGWFSTAAVSSLTFTCDAGGSFAQYSTFSLYGIR